MASLAAANESEERGKKEDGGNGEKHVLSRKYQGNPWDRLCLHRDLMQLAVRAFI